MNPLRTLLACSLILASGVVFAAEANSPTAADKEAAASKASLQYKLEHIILPKLDLRDVTIRDAVDFLKRKSIEGDENPPAGSRGVNIVLKLAEEGTVPASAPAAASPVPAENPADARITLSLTNISLLEALKYVTGLANLKFRVEPHCVAIVPLHEPTGSLITKEWKIPPDLIPLTPPAGSGPGIVDRESARNWLLANGVAFEGAATAIYVIKRSRLIVRNTQDQLDLVDAIVHQGSGGSLASVEIECHFVDIQGNDLKEWNFDALLREVNSPATQNVFVSGGGDVGHPAPPVKTSGPVIRGTNASNFKITSGPIEVLTFPQSNATATSCVFTDPQFQRIFRSLQKKKGVEFLSMPRMTVKSGRSMVVEIIRAFHYPLEDPLPQIPSASSSLAPGQFPMLQPLRSNENRELDLTLDVNPVVGPDGYTIDLKLSHQAREFESDLGQGEPVVATTTNAITGAAMRKILTPCLHPLPIFSTRMETQSISVFDGSTVVLDGLPRRDSTDGMEEFFLGSVPFLQPLFRSTPDHPVQRRVLIFVTARLVNAGSSPSGTGDEKEPVFEAKPIVPPSEELPLTPK